MRTPHLKFPFALALAIGVLSSGSAYALPQYVSTTRSVNSEGVVEDLGLAVPESDAWNQGFSSTSLTGTFNNAAGGSASIQSATATGNAGQNTTIAGGHLFGNGSSVNVSVETNPPVEPTGDTENLTLFQTVFNLTADHFYTLTGALSAFQIANGSAIANGLAEFLLEDAALNPILSFSTDVDPSPVSLNSSGMLNPGQYTLTVFASTDVSSGPTQGFGISTASYDFDLVLTVPEPSTFLLMGTGLVGLIGVARRRM